MRFIIDHDRRFGTRAVNLRAALKAGAGDQRIIRFAEVFELLVRRTNEQVANEQRLARKLADYAELLGVFLVRAGKAVEHEYFAPLQVRDHLGLDGVELFALDRYVDLAPRNQIVHAFAVHDKFILRAAAGVFAGLDKQGAVVHQNAFLALQRFFHKLRNRQVAVDRFRIDDADRFEIHNVRSFAVFIAERRFPIPPHLNFSILRPVSDCKQIPQVDRVSLTPARSRASGIPSCRECSIPQRCPRPRRCSEASAACCTESRCCRSYPFCC